MGDFFAFLKSTHYILMIILLAGLIFTTGKFYLNAINKQPFELFEKRQSLFFLALAHLQLIIGLILLFGVYGSAFSDMGSVMKNSEVRFTMIEHPLTMIIGIVLITIGYALAKRKKSDAKKFKTIAIYYGIALLVILLRIPWSRLHG
jgi:heme A synthase